MGYEDSAYGSHYAPGQGHSGSDTYQSPGGPGTPSRGGRNRPSQPPPAPPSNASSNSTPTIASANNTPTRGRSMSTGRDTLPPPPPPPGETMSPPSMNGELLYLGIPVLRHFSNHANNYILFCIQVRFHLICSIETAAGQIVHCRITNQHLRLWQQRVASISAK